MVGVNTYTLIIILIILSIGIGVLYVLIFAVILPIDLTETKETMVLGYDINLLKVPYLKSEQGKVKNHLSQLVNEMFPENIGSYIMKKRKALLLIAYYTKV